MTWRFLVLISLVIGGFLVKQPLPSCAESIAQSSNYETLRAGIYFSDGVMKSISGDLYGAIADFTEAIRIKKDYINAYFARGSLKDQLGDKKGANADYTAAIQIKPKNYQDYLDRGNGKNFHLRDEKGAIADYTTAIQLKPDYAEAYHRRGGLNYLGDPYGAIAD